MTKRAMLMSLVALAALFPVACGKSSAKTIQGAGATFPAPLYKRWFLECYHAKHDTRVNYQVIGSGAGVSQLQEGLTDFAASDEALKQERLAEVAKVAAPATWLNRVRANRSLTIRAKSIRETTSQVPSADRCPASS